jgi:hypothetical protein
LTEICALDAVRKDDMTSKSQSARQGDANCNF